VSWWQLIVLGFMLAPIGIALDKIDSKLGRILDQLAYANQDLRMREYSIEHAPD